MTRVEDTAASTSIGAHVELLDALDRDDATRALALLPRGDTLIRTMQAIQARARPKHAHAIESVLARGMSEQDARVRYYTAQAATVLAASGVPFGAGLVAAIGDGLGDRTRLHGGMPLGDRIAQALANSALRSPAARAPVLARFADARSAEDDEAQGAHLGTAIVATLEGDVATLEMLFLDKAGSNRVTVCRGVAFAAVRGDLGVRGAADLDRAVATLLRRVVKEDGAAAVRKEATRALDAWKKPKHVRKKKE